jgi:hypothetical protein
MNATSAVSFYAAVAASERSNLGGTAQVDIMWTLQTGRMKEGVVKTAVQLESCLATGRVTTA